MSSRKRRSDSSDDVQPAKKGKPSWERPPKIEDEAGEPYWELSSKKRLTISEYKGITLLSMREYYQKDGKTLPGRGISLTPEQVAAMILALPEALAYLKETKGVALPELGKGEGEEEEEKLSEEEEHDDAADEDEDDS